jgi:hypothetical protein
MYFFVSSYYLKADVTKDMIVFLLKKAIILQQLYYNLKVIQFRSSFKD